METKEKLIGRRHLKKITNPIKLESVSNFNYSDFFATKDQGGIFDALCGEDALFIGNAFIGNKAYSPELTLANYELADSVYERGLLEIASKLNIYRLLTMTHVMQICKLHIINGVKLLKEDGAKNIFWVSYSFEIVVYLEPVNKKWCAKMIPRNDFKLLEPGNAAFFLDC